MVTQFIMKADIDRAGSCHLIRHSCVPHMHDNGADIRIIQHLSATKISEKSAISTEASINQLKLVHAKTHSAHPAEQRDKPRKDC
ncbi:MAG: integrase/recombinase XerD [Verrucomicrobiales bacterium]|jgi:integrase/recombinase XerD